MKPNAEPERVEDRHGLRTQLLHSMQLYERGVKRTSEEIHSTADDIVSAITQLVHHGECNTKFPNAAAARGLHIAVASLVQAHTRVDAAETCHETKNKHLHMAQELVYSCLGYYLPEAESGEPVPMLNIGDCRHSTSIILQALSQHEPAQVVAMLRTMIHAAGEQSKVRFCLLFLYHSIPFME